MLLAPVLLGIALAVRLTSPGPVLYRQERVGLNGRPSRCSSSAAWSSTPTSSWTASGRTTISDGLLFKMRDDPRVTPVGRWLRRLSLDELPQLFNVLARHACRWSVRARRCPARSPGTTPRCSRRLLVKPGLTGLWQISGRSDLSWEESVRLDLRYVENWSLALDLLILWKTARAVLSSSGAY